MHKINTLAAAFCGVLAFTPAGGQAGICPPNIGFESGNLSNWECRTGSVESIGGVNTITWTGFTQRPFHHTVYANTGSGNDIFGGFPLACPNGSGYSLKLGGSNLASYSAEGVFYTFSIPDTAALYSILYYYAVVFQDPQHLPDEQPRFRARVYNVTDNAVIGCSDFDFTASASLPGFRVSTVDTSVIYKDWTPVTLNLSGYAGKTLRLEFITSDCTYTGHFGYAYVDVSGSCSNAITGAAICPNADSVTITAPHGFQTYTWYSDPGYSTILSNSQTMTLSPPPPAGSEFPVVVGPYPGFGCPDTMVAVIRTAGLPVADAGPDVEFCEDNQAQLGVASIPGMQYNWMPDSLVVSATTSMTLTKPGLNSPALLYLTVADSSSGCVNFDTVLVTPVNIDTSMIVTGGTVFCRSAAGNTILRALSTDGNIQWYENGTAIPGANTGIFIPQPSSDINTYYAIITKGACSRSTRNTEIRLLPGPVAGFLAEPAEQCVGGPVQVLNQTTMPNNASLDFTWELSDGRIFSSRDISVSFTAPGEYDVSLKAVAAGGCSDSTGGKIKVIENCSIWVPSAFSPDGDGKNDLFRPLLFGRLNIRRFSVYERNGQLLYSTRQAGGGWDGTFKGKKIPASVLVWLLEYENPDGKTVLLKGTVTLLR